MIGNVQAESCFLKCLKVYNQIFVTPYASRIKFITYKDTWDEAGTKFWLLVLLVVGSGHAIDFKAEGNQSTFEFAIESQIIWRLIVFPHVDEVV